MSDKKITPLQKVIPVGISFKTYTQNGTLFEPLAGLTVINQGDNCNVFVNQVKLIPGQQFQVDLNNYEQFYQQFNITFETIDIAQPVTPYAFVILKKYL